MVTSSFASALNRILSAKPSPEALRLAERYGYLPYMVERYLRMLGPQGARELLEANEEPMPETIRCNDYLIDCSELVERLQGRGFELAPLRFAPHGYEVLSSSVSVGATHEYLLGYYYVQDPASMLPVYELRPMPGEFILDMAAAPGGKATQILQLAMDRARLIAVDISRRRLRALRSHLSRMRFSNYVILRADSRTLGFSSVFDAVLLDAPSTGEGIIRKDPARKKSRSPTDLKLVASLQRELLGAGVEYLRPGGRLVYAACTLAAEEGELVVSSILEEREDLEVEPLSIPHEPGVEEFMGVEFDPRVRRCGRLYPHIHGTEGFFVCKLRKRPG